MRCRPGTLNNILDVNTLNDTIQLQTKDNNVAQYKVVAVMLNEASRQCADAPVNEDCRSGRCSHVVYVANGKHFSCNLVLGRGGRWFNYDALCGVYYDAIDNPSCIGDLGHLVQVCCLILELQNISQISVHALAAQVDIVIFVFVFVLIWC